MAKLTHLEVQNAFLKDGVSAILKIISDASASSYTLRRALRELQESNVDATALARVLKENGFMTSKLAKPDVGDVRDYKVQEENNRRVLKIPVDYLDVKAGEEVAVTFDVNGFRASLK